MCSSSTKRKSNGLALFCSQPNDSSRWEERLQSVLLVWDGDAVILLFQRMKRSPVARPWSQLCLVSESLRPELYAVLNETVSWRQLFVDEGVPLSVMVDE